MAQNRAGLARWRATGGRLSDRISRVTADALLRLGRFDEGLATVAEGLEEAASMNETLGGGRSVAP